MTSSTTVPGVDQERIHQESIDLGAKAPGIVPFMEEEMARFEGESARFQAGEIEVRRHPFPQLLRIQVSDVTPEMLVYFERQPHRPHAFEKRIVA